MLPSNFELTVMTPAPHQTITKTPEKIKADCSVKNVVALKSLHEEERMIRGKKEKEKRERKQGKKKSGSDVRVISEKKKKRKEKEKREKRK